MLGRKEQKKERKKNEKGGRKTYGKSEAMSLADEIELAVIFVVMLPSAQAAEQKKAAARPPLLPSHPPLVIKSKGWKMAVPSYICRRESVSVDPRTRERRAEEKEERKRRKGRTGMTVVMLAAIEPKRACTGLWEERGREGGW